MVTLEQLQRAHIAQLGQLREEPRGHYVRIFRGPLDWVRRRLGHRSVLTALICLNPRELSGAQEAARGR
ncbi:hypothetical protein [Streptomyces sp. JNUCC 63]